MSNLLYNRYGRCNIWGTIILPVVSSLVSRLGYYPLFFFSSFSSSVAESLNTRVDNSMTIENHREPYAW